MSLAPALRRIRKDIQKIQKEGDSGILIDMEALMEGPEGTAWQGGIFQLSLKFNQQYPNKCPEVKFKSKMFHPNIYADGRICLDILNTQWSPVYDTWAILISIRSLLSNPNPLSPANNGACEIFINNKIQYERKVKQIVIKSLQDQQQEEQVIQS